MSNGVMYAPFAAVYFSLVYPRSASFFNNNSKEKKKKKLFSFLPGRAYLFIYFRGSRVCGQTALYMTPETKKKKSKET